MTATAAPVRDADGCTMVVGDLVEFGHSYCTVREIRGPLVRLSETVCLFEGDTPVEITAWAEATACHRVRRAGRVG